MEPTDDNTVANDQAVTTSQQPTSVPVVNDIAPPAASVAPADEVGPPAAQPVESPEVVPAAPVTDDTRKVAPHLIVEAVLLLALLGTGLYAHQLGNSRNQLKAQVVSLNANPTIVAQRQTDQLIAKVGSLMQLPTGEVPTVANVSDAAKAKQQSAFFANAQNGDRVLMYVKAGEAILYRPSTNKIVLVAPLTLTNNNTAATTKQ